MGLKLFEIVFEDNPSTTFLASQKISGNVVVEIDQVDMKIQELVIRLWGKAEVSWVDSKGKGRKDTPTRPKDKEKDNKNTPTNNKKEKLFSNEESYFDRRQTIVERVGDSDLLIPIGRSLYPFTVGLPSGIPSSFEGEHGQVQYFLEASIKRPSGQYDHNTKTPLTVLGILDLNTDSQAQIEKPEVSHEENLCYWPTCFKNGPVGFQFSLLGTQGVTPGDRVQFLSDIYNMSEASTVSMKLKLVQVTTYHVQHYCKTVKKELFQLEGPSVRRGGTGTWAGERIEIPGDIPPTRLAGKCSLISIEYYLEITLETHHGKDVKASLPLIVGTVPFEVKVEDFITSKIENIRSTKTVEIDLREPTQF